MIYVVELTAAVDAIGSQRVFYLGTEGFQTAPEDVLPNIDFDARGIDVGSIGLHLFSDGQTGGGTRLEVGELRFANADGEFDGWRAYGFDGRACVVRAGLTGAAYPGGFSTLLTAATASVQVTLDEAIVRVTDKAATLDRPVLTETFAGDNESGEGLEGTAADIKGALKPLCLGVAPNISPPCVNPGYLVFRVSYGPVEDISAVYDKGEPRDFGADHADNAALFAATIAAGDYDTCLAEGLFRLGGSPVGQVTADVTAAADDADMAAAGLMLRLAQLAGLTEAEISGTDLEVLAVQAPEVLGRYVDSDLSFRTLLDEIMGSVGGWYAFDALGVLRCGVLEAPSEVAVADLLEGEILEGFEADTPDRDGIPVWRVSVRHSRNWTVQTSDLAGDVTDERRAFLAQEHRIVVAEDPAIKIQFKLAGELTIDTLLTDPDDAEAEAERLLALHGVRRDLFRTPVQIGTLPDEDLALMSTITLTHSRFGLAAGRNLRIIGRTLELSEDQAILQLWG